MAGVIYLDTVVAARLCVPEGVALLSRGAIQAIEAAEEILLSPVVLFELQAIYRKGRIPLPPGEIFARLQVQCDVALCVLPMAEVVLAAMGIAWTRDPMDSLIVGQAMANGRAGLVTSDELIRANYAGAIW